MSELDPTTSTAVEAPPAAKRKVKKAKRAKPARAPSPSTADRPVETKDELSGISVTACPSACTAARCVISTVGVCKHPFKTSESGCGPITMRNRERALKLIKHQMIDLKG